MRSSLSDKSIDLDNGLSWHLDAEDIQDMLLLVNPDRMIIYINHGVPGYNYTDILGMNIYEFLAPEHHKKLEYALDNAFNDNESHEYKVQLKPDGKKGDCWFLTRIKPVFRQQSVEMVMILITDITQQEHTEKAFRRAYEKLTSALDIVDKPEKILEICAWTKKVKMNGRWVNFEDFLEERFGYKISHGIADDVAREELKSLKKGK